METLEMESLETHCEKKCQLIMNSHPRLMSRVLRLTQHPDSLIPACLLRMSMTYLHQAIVEFALTITDWRN